MISTIAFASLVAAIARQNAEGAYELHADETRYILQLLNAWTHIASPEDLVALDELRERGSEETLIWYIWTDRGALPGQQQPLIQKIVDELGGQATLAIKDGQRSAILITNLIPVQVYDRQFRVIDAQDGARVQTTGDVRRSRFPERIAGAPLAVANILIPPESTSTGKGLMTSTFAHHLVFPPVSYDVVQSSLFQESGSNASTEEAKIENFRYAMEQSMRMDRPGWGEFPQIHATTSIFSKEDLDEYREAELEGYAHELAYSRPPRYSDIGLEIAHIDDGHNRAYAASRVGIPLRIKRWE